MKYNLTPELAVELDQQTKQMKFSDISRLAAYLCGFKFEKVTEQFAVIVDEATDSRGIMFAVGDLDFEALAKEHEATLYEPLNDMSVTQELCRKFGIGIEPMVSVNGNLACIWKAQRLGSFGSMSSEVDYIVKPQDENLTIAHANASVAVALCAALVIGIGASSYIVFDETGNSTFIRRSVENIDNLYRNGFGVNIFPVPELDAYVTTKPDTEELAKVISEARAKHEEAKANIAAQKSAQEQVEQADEAQVNEPALAEEAKDKTEEPASVAEENHPTPEQENQPAPEQDNAQAAE